VPSRYDAATACLAVDGHQMNNRDPIVYKTTDYGATWRSITAGLPKDMLSYTKVIAEDPIRRGLLYLGTENGIYASFDDGARWIPLQNNLPHAPVSGIVVQEHFNDLVISTYGRGFWIMDDIGPLQQLTAAVLADPAHLFTLRPAYRFRNITAPSTTYDDPTVGRNPEYGASINYYLAAPAATAPTLTVRSAAGEVVRTLQGSNAAGINRLHWDLRYEPTTEPRLLTSPRYAPHIEPGPTGRAAPGAGTLSLLAPPGTYSVTLSAGGVERSQSLVVRKDPNSGGSEAEIAAQTALLVAIGRNLNDAAAAVHRIEAVRVQLEGLGRVVKDAAIRQAADSLNERLQALEMNLVDLRQTGTGQDGVRFGSKLMSKLNYLAAGLASNDFKPTDQQVEVHQILDQQLRGHLAALASLWATELQGFNDRLRRENVANIVLP
jgi:hypothetical protein